MSTSSTTCSDSVCSICLDTCSVVSYADGCLHKFCGRCIFEWAQRSQLCPICRTFFANIITNVISDTEYEVIPLEDRRVPVPNFIRDSSWWNNSNPSNRNIFTVRQFVPRSHHNQPNQQSQAQQVATSAIEPVRPNQHSSRNLNEPQVNNLQIDVPRPRRVIWASHRYSQRQFNRQQQQSQQQQQQHQQRQPQPQPQTLPQVQPQLASAAHLENVAAFRQIISPAFRQDYYNRGHNQSVNTSPRHLPNPRPFRPLVGVRQENHPNQHQHPSQSNYHLNVNYQNHTHSYPNSHSQSHYYHNFHQPNPHPLNVHNSHPHPSQHHHPRPAAHSGPHHQHNSQTAYKRLSRPNHERQWRR